jgi:curved DNA-binding protein
MENLDYYELLQISPRADQETIHRVYRFLGARFHPDNPATGNAEKFSRLKKAYEVLSDSARRAEYDAAREKDPPKSAPLSSSIDFMDNQAGETNRRLGLLAVLYFRRRANPVFPEVSLAEVEMRLGFPRDYLDFTTWYLCQKGYITVADNSDFALTVDGVDYVETERASIPVLNRLLTSGSESFSNGSAGSAASVMSHNLPADTSSVPDGNASPTERRSNNRDRRGNAPDRRSNPVERRSSARDRRSKD